MHLAGSASLASLIAEMEDLVTFVQYEGKSLNVTAIN